MHCKGGGHQSLSGLGLGGLGMRSTEKEQRERRKQNGAAVDSAGGGCGADYKRFQ